MPDPHPTGHVPRHRLLVVDDNAIHRDYCRMLLEPMAAHCVTAADGELALMELERAPYDLVLLDSEMPNCDGRETLRRIRIRPGAPHLKVIMMSAAGGDELSRMMRAGADDFLTKPFTDQQLLERVASALRLKDSQEQVAVAQRNLRRVNAGLEATLAARNSDLAEARNALVLSLAELVATRDTETGGHLLRLQHYSKCLAEHAAGLSAFANEIDDAFISLLACCAPLHDIGKVGVRDNILLKPGKLDPDERAEMEKHTVIAADVLNKVASRHATAVGFLHMAIDIARHHHERYDGRGYPDRLAGEAIPLAARIVAIADVYDALRSPRPYKQGWSHAEALRIMDSEEGHFDPALYAGFRRHCAPAFEKLYAELTD